METRFDNKKIYEHIESKWERQWTLIYNNPL